VAIGSIDRESQFSAFLPLRHEPRGRIINAFADDDVSVRAEARHRWRERLRAAFAAGVLQPSPPRRGPEPDDDVMHAWRDKVREIKARELERRRERWRRYRLDKRRTVGAGQ
jgi:hypothetical protein